jgi:hypothetical protein
MIERALKLAWKMGFKPKEFWELPLYEFNLCCDAYEESVLERHNELYRLVVGFRADLKKFDFKKILGYDPPQMNKKKSTEELKKQHAQFERGIMNG